jgi:arylsulfatase I/J
MATPFHTPEGRGYDTTLNYFTHKNDFWNMQSDQDACQQPVVDLWQANKSVSPAGSPAFGLNGTMYEELLFEKRLLRIVTNHDAQKPLFLFYAAHVGHFPLQVPEDYFSAQPMVPGVGDVTSCEKATGAIWPGHTGNYSCRRQYHAMVSVLDRVLGNVTAALKKKGMWENLLMVFCSDNGGQNKMPNAGGNNYPLRGGKYSPWEGGVRVAVSGVVRGNAQLVSHDKLLLLPRPSSPPTLRSQGVCLWWTATSSCPRYSTAWHRSRL